MNNNLQSILRSMMSNSVINQLPFIATSKDEFAKLVEQNLDVVKHFHIMNNPMYNFKVAFVYGDYGKKLKEAFFADEENAKYSISDYDHVLKTLAVMYNENTLEAIIFSEDMVNFVANLGHDVALHVIKMLIYENKATNKLIGISKSTLENFLQLKGALMEICKNYENESGNYLNVFRVCIKHMDSNIKNFGAIVKFLNKIEVSDEELWKITTYGSKHWQKTIEAMSEVLSTCDVVQGSLYFKNIITSVGMKHGKKSSYTIEEIYEVIEAIHSDFVISETYANTEVPLNVIQYVINPATRKLAADYLSIRKIKLNFGHDPINTVFEYMDEYEMIPAPRNFLAALFNFTDEIEYIYEVLSNGHCAKQPVESAIGELPMLAVPKDKRYMYKHKYTTIAKNLSVSYDEVCRLPIPTELYFKFEVIDKMCDSPVSDSIYVLMNESYHNMYTGTIMQKIYIDYFIYLILTMSIQDIRNSATQISNIVNMLSAVEIEDSEIKKYFRDLEKQLKKLDKQVHKNTPKAYNFRKLKKELANEKMTDEERVGELKESDFIKNLVELISDNTIYDI